MSVFLSYFCSTQMFFYHSFILYFYFYCTPCGSNYFYIPWIYITFTFLCSFPILFHFHSSLISDILYQPLCCFLCCVFNVNVVYICRSEMGRALPDLRKSKHHFGCLLFAWSLDKIGFLFPLPSIYPSPQIQLLHSSFCAISACWKNID